MAKLILKMSLTVDGLHLAQTTKSLDEAIDARGGGRASSSSVRGDRQPPNAVSWDEPEVLGENLKKDIERLKQRPGKPLLVHGGAGFARKLLATGTVDELRLTVHPIALGKGLGIFGEVDCVQTFEPVTLIRFASGLIGHVLRPI